MCLSFGKRTATNEYEYIRCVCANCFSIHYHQQRRLWIFWPTSKLFSAFCLFSSFFVFLLHATCNSYVLSVYINVIFRHSLLLHSILSYFRFECRCRCRVFCDYLRSTASFHFIETHLCRHHRKKLLILFLTLRTFSNITKFYICTIFYGSHIFT